MARLIAQARFIIGALALLFVVAVATPVGAQRQPDLVNPTADSVKEDQLLREMNRISGRGTIPDAKQRAELVRYFDGLG